MRMTHRAPTRRSSLVLLVIALALALATAGCWQRPLREGTQMREFPAGFRYEDNVTSANDLLPNLERLPQRSYLCIGEDDQVSDITMSEYTSVVSEADVRAAFESKRSRIRFPTYGDLEAVRVGQRDGWGWTETQTGKNGELLALKWTIVLPYDDRAFLLEYFSSMPKHMDLATMRAQLDQFAYVRNGKIVK